MTQKKIGDILYVFSTTPFEITQDTDATTIRVQQECLEGYKALNSSIASKIVPFNYHVMVATVQEWNEYVDASGESGAQGSQGTQGTQGAQGSQGTQGTQGAQGSQGTQGTQGAQSEVEPVAPYFHLFDNYGGFEVYSGSDDGWDNNVDYNPNYEDSELSEGVDGLCSYLDENNTNVTAKLYNNIEQYKDSTTGEYDETAMAAGALTSTEVIGGSEDATFIFEHNNEFITVYLNNGSGLTCYDDSNYIAGKIRIVLTYTE